MDSQQGDKSRWLVISAVADEDISRISVRSTTWSSRFDDSCERFLLTIEVEMPNMFCMLFRKPYWPKINLDLTEVAESVQSL